MDRATGSRDTYAESRDSIATETKGKPKNPNKNNSMRDSQIIDAKISNFGSLVFK